MHGITLTKAPEDWEILQQDKGYALVKLEGNYQVHPAALEVGVESACPIIRVVREKDNSIVIPWKMAEEVEVKENFSGTFRIDLLIPEGGLYRIDTSLETKSICENLTWLYRGDCILHLGVGNLFIIAGQSNAAGYSRDASPDEPHLCVHLFRNRGKWDLASHPMNESTGAGSPPNEEMGIPGPSPYLSFAKTLYEYTKSPVGLIQTALGGSPIARWKPDTGDLYQNMVERINATSKKFKGILWYQGCSDTDIDNVAQYYEKFKEFVTAVRAQFGEDIPFFTFQLNRQLNGLYDEGWGLVREAQRRVAKEIKDVYILPTTNCSLSDGIHNTAQANVVLGVKLAKQYCGTMLGGEPYLAPDVVKVILLSEEERNLLHLKGIWLELTYDNVTGCFLLFSSLGNDSGFTVSDIKGDIHVKSIRSNRQDNGRVYLELDREPGGNICLSFAWEAYPVIQPFVDEATYLPPLSFYQRNFTI